jgi:N-methylhydantoinase A/oxoprolinase/acetone carboxylase beta subunit
MATYRIGIDVGGTFTHAVALDAASFSLAAQAKVPTTHRAERGVAEGVVEALRLLLGESAIAPSDVSFLAYSTTQITNALLEGDVAPVGIVAIGSGLEGKRAQAETRLGDLELAPGRRLRTFHTGLGREGLSDIAAAAAVSELIAAGAQVIVAAEAFSVDDPSREQMVIAAAQKAGLPATGTHEISGRYGLRIRTRTAVINASLLPKTVATADLTEKAVREAGIAAPLMVVRSDGGVMSVEDMRRRPLLTLLSGPAAGVAAALMYVRVSDGIFLEVGGTSTDITAIQHGRALLRTAEVGGHRLFLRTLDVRTIGVAGGSMPRARGSSIIDVGPRSAHLAGLQYSCFTDPGDLRHGDEPRAVTLSPVEGDPADYVALETAAGKRIGITLTCAANAVDQVPPGDWAHGNPDSARIGMNALGTLLGKSAEDSARSFIETAAAKASRTVEALIADRRMHRETTGLVAGGGGASALVPAVGRHLDMPVRLALNAPVVSAIGTALAVVRDVVERTVPEATEADVLQIRREAAEAVVRAGADPESVTVDVEYHSATAVLRAVATGQTELRERDLAQTLASDEERAMAAANASRLDPDWVQVVADSGSLRAYQGARERRRLLGLGRRVERPIALVDGQGVVRLVLPSGAAAAADAANARGVITRLLEEHTKYGDAGAELPQLFLGLRGRIVNLSGLLNAAQVLALAQAETAGLAADEKVMVVVASRRG